MLLGVLLEGGGDLIGELTGRLDDQRARHARLGAPGGETVDHRQGETGGLACAGLGDAQHVATLQDDRDRLLLDRGRFGIAGVGDGLENFWTQAKI